MAEKPPEEGYISVVDEEPEIFELLKWDNSHTHPKQQELPRPIEKPPTEMHEPLRNQRPTKDAVASKSKSSDTDPFIDWSDSLFVEVYRLSKTLARILCEELAPVMPDSTKTIDFPIENKILATLSFYATGKYQKSFGPCKSEPSISQYYVSTAVLQVTEAMNHPSIVKKYIHFPHLRQERDLIKARFYMKYGIPDVVGCIDCMHVPMARPDSEHQKIHFNKSYHSKKVQIICDSEQTILSVDATAGGSYSHDNILNRHAVRVDLQSLNQSGECCWLIGGPYYSQKPYLMAPMPKMTKKSPVSPEKYYSTIHGQAFSAVCDTIKQLKTRWKCLQATCNKQFDPSTVSMMIVACCVLHNICLRHGLPVAPMTHTEERLETMKQKVANGPIPRKIQTPDANGLEARARLTERLWNERRVVPECGPTKKRMSKKDRILESHHAQQQNIPQQSIPLTLPPPPQMHHQSHHEDMSKRPRILSVTTPTYSLGVPPGWGHYPQH